jgi:hypothetical protein
MSEPKTKMLEAACKLTLLFYSAGHWGDDKRAQWANLMTEVLGAPLEPMAMEATTRNLCIAVRTALNYEPN